MLDHLEGVIAPAYRFQCLRKIVEFHSQYRKDQKGEHDKREQEFLYNRSVANLRYVHDYTLVNHLDFVQELNTSILERDWTAQLDIPRYCFYTVARRKLQVADVAYREMNW